MTDDEWEKVNKDFFKAVDCDIEAYFKVRILNDKIDNSLPKWIHK